MTTRRLPALQDARARLNAAQRVIAEQNAEAHMRALDARRWRRIIAAVVWFVTLAVLVSSILPRAAHDIAVALALPLVGLAVLAANVARR